MAFQNFITANNAKTTLGSNLLIAGTSLVVTTGTGALFPSAYPYLLTLEKKVLGVVTKREIIKVTNKTTDTFTIVRSAGYCPFDDTAKVQTNTASSFDSGDIVSLRVTAEQMKDIGDEIIRLGLNTVPLASNTDYGITKLSTSSDVSIGTATISIATPGVVTKASHGLVVGDVVKFTSTGALPTGLTIGNNYFIIATGFTTGAFRLSNSEGGSAINTTGTQSGVHTLIKTTPIVVGDNDPRIPTLGEKQALAGTSGTPGAGNKYVTATDTTFTNTVKLTGNQTIAGIKTFSSIPVLPASDPIGANDLVRKSYADGLFTVGPSLYLSLGADYDDKLYYRKIGAKTYVIYYNYGGTSYNINGDIDSATKIATSLGETYSSHSATDYGYWFARVYTWTGSKWSSTSNYTTVLQVLTVA